MDSVEAIKAKIGNDTYLRLVKEAEKEVALAKAMPLMDQDQHETFYRPRFLLGELRADCETFQKAGFKILPSDIVNIQFRCKLLRSVQTEQEYRQRGGGVGLFDDFTNNPKWSDRTENVDVLIERYIAALEAGFQERTLLTYISSFSSAGPGESLQASFEDLFSTLGFPYVCFFEGEHLVERHKQFEPWLRVYEKAAANEFFSAPSIGFRVPSGSSDYCFWYSSMWLRTFLNMLRIAAYIYPGQRDFGRDVKMTAPTHPVFLGQHAHGCYAWFEDKKQSWEKIPDGCLFRSFGYRGLSNMWLDFRTLPLIKRFLVDNRKIFENLNNPWHTSNINDVAPTLDILNSATQIPDTGAKILLIYCCLEHLFVPKNVTRDNKKYIIGGINALAPHLLDWFSHLNNIRNGYAHKGFVLSEQKTLTLVVDSMRNVISLLVAKLSV